MGSVGKALNPAGGNFLGLGGTIGRAVGDVATGGLAEFARPDSFGVPQQYATPLKIAAGLGAAGMATGGLSNALGSIGGPLGSMASGIAGGAGAAGSGFGGLGQMALGGSLLGLGLSKSTDQDRVNLPNADDDQARINAERLRQQQLIQSLMQQNRPDMQQAMQDQAGIFQSAQGQVDPLIQQQQQQQQGLTDRTMSQQQNLFSSQRQMLNDILNKRRQFAEQQLTTGPEGEAFREQYNRLGLLNSGAFNTGLANQFSDLQRQSDIEGEQQQLAQTQGLSDLINHGYGTQEQLGLGGLTRKFGLQDQSLGAQSQIAGQGYQRQGQLQNAGLSLDAELGNAGLQRRLGLEDTQAQMDLARAAGDAQRKAQLQQALIGGGSYILGGGMNGGGGGGGAGAAAGPGGFDPMSAIMALLNKGRGMAAGGGGYPVGQDYGNV